MAVDALLLDAGLRQSLVALRSLGRRGLTVAALDARGDAPAFSSRWCSEKIVVPAPPPSAAYVAHLDALIDRIGPRVLVASADSTVALLQRHRPNIASRVAVAVADDRALAIAVNKTKTLAVAQQLGLHIPRSMTLHSIDDVPAAVRDIGLPAVIKPAESWLWAGDGGVRVVSEVVTTIDEARRAVASLTALGDAPLYQQLLSGRREAVSFLYAHGVVYARFAQFAKRTAPPLGGESVLRQSIAVPADIGDGAERLVRAIDLEGYSEVEFRRDDRGTPFLMEINPRLSASVEVAVRAGVDFPHLLYQWASGRPIDTVSDYRVGQWMRHLRGDIMTTLAALRRRGRPEVSRPWSAVLDFGLSFLRPMGYDYVDWTDPLPALTATREFVRDAARGALKLAAQKTWL